MSIRLVRVNERSRIQEFIHTHWRKNHVLSTCDDLFDYLYLNKIDSCYNILISDQDNTINGMLGFIKASHYDNNLSPEMDICWCSVWKVLTTSTQKLLGISLLRTLLDSNNHIKRATIGANIKTLPIYKALGYQTGHLSRFIALNNDRKNTTLVKSSVNIKKQASNLDDNSLDDVSMKLLSGKDIICSKDEIDRYAVTSKSHRTFEYLKARYLQNPFYRYKVAKLSGESGSTYFVYRKIIHGNASMLKIVDLMGDVSLVSKMNSNLRKNLISDSEYIEFSCYGLEKELMSAGFIDLSVNQDISIPKYFEPLVYDASPIHWSLLEKNPLKKSLIFCGDADQDRPNFVKIKK